MEDKKAIGARLKAIRVKNNLTGKELGELLGIGKAGVSSYELGKTYPKIESILLIADRFNEDVNYILTGNESENKSSDNQPPAPVATRTKDQMPTVVTVDNEGRENIPLVHVKARAGYLSGFADPEFIETLPAYRLPNVNHGTYRMFEVEGRSMAPTLNPGDIVITEWIEHPGQMRDDRIYILVTHDEGILIKRCVNRLNNPEMGFILAKSDNTIKQANKEEYPNILVRPHQIKEIWYARWYLSSQFTAPSDLYNRVNNLEAEIEIFKELAKRLAK